MSEEAGEGEAKKPSQKKKTIGRTVGLILVLLAIVAIAYGTGLTSYVSLDNLDMLRGWIDSFGALATIIFIVVYAAAVVAFLPATPLTLLAGLVFGAVWGTLWGWIGATLGATLAFLVGRYATRELGRV